MILFFIVSLAPLLFMLWALYANGLTLEQRFQVVDWVYENPGYVQYRHKIYLAVPYEAHMWRNIFLLNPWVLYENAAKQLELGHV